MIRRLAGYWARRLNYRHPHLDYDDFTSIAVVEALRVMPQWDPNKGTLSTFLTPRIKGAIQHAWRMYRRSRQPAGSYRDHETIRYHGAETDEATTENLLLSTQTPPSRLETLDELARLRRRITITQWLVLILRYGQGLSQRETGEVIGFHATRITQIERNLRERFGLERLPISTSKHRKD